MAEEHLHRLHVVFNQFREYNLKLKLSKCSLFKEEINYLVHQVSKGGVPPSNSNLRAIPECAPPQIYTEILAFYWPCGPLLAVHKVLCAYHTAAEWTPLRRRGQYKIRTGVTIRRCRESLQCSEMSVQEHPSPGLC